MTATITLGEAVRMRAMQATYITDRRANLAKLATAGADLSRLSGAMNEVAEAEGVFQALARLASVLKYAAEHPGAELDSPREALTELVLRGADDAWSGRGNDIKRAQHDGLRKQVEILLRAL